MKRSIPWRLILYSVLLLGASIALVQHLGNLAELGNTAKRAQLVPLVFALVLQTLTLWNQPALYQALYQLVGLDVNWRDLAPLVWAGHFINVATPSAGLGGTALLLSDAAQHGFDLPRVSLASTLYFLFNFAWFSILLAVGIIVLWTHHDLKGYEIVGSAFLLGAVVLALAVLVLVSVRPQLLGGLLVGLARPVNFCSRLALKREILPAHHLQQFASDFGATAYALRAAKGRLLRPIFHTLLVDGLEILVLGACFWAFPGQGIVTPGVVVAGYAIGTLFLILSVTPQGLGVVEGVMTATFVSLGIPLERAAVVVLMYRGLSFWLPLVAGFFASRRILIPTSARLTP